DKQHYRLAWWRTAPEAINWRRFFEITDLAGLRVEQDEVFETVHELIFRLYAEGWIDGVRIDHIDGLSDPRTYCRHLRKRLKPLARQRPPTAPSGPAYIVVEKILAPEERLPDEWQVDGTTGYSFMNEVSALLHNPAGESELTRLWTALSGRSGDFDVESHRARRRILQELLAAEFNACAYALHRIARANPATRDWSLLAIRRVLTELLVQFPIYRTYADGRGRSAADTEIMRAAIDAAHPFCSVADWPLLDLIDGWLGADSLQPEHTPRERRMRLRAITRFQQLSSPLAAKSVEDTAFYRHGRLLSRNEVGANPAQFAISSQEFHAECQRRARHFPRALLATATHDHKRGEDLRARLAIISQIAEPWSGQVHRWIAANARHKNPQPQWPLIADEYMLYQMLVGGWPLDLQPNDTVGVHQLCERLQQWWQKALREAKQISSWGTPNHSYETACQSFLNQLLDRSQSQHFIDELASFARSIAAAGCVNGLAQTLLKLTIPGIPDIYQGSELWDFSFVDPDNRRAVDYTHRQQLLAARANPSALIRDWQNGAIKQQIIQRTLQLRRNHSELFEKGEYQPLPVVGSRAQHIFAFERRWRHERVIVATLRFPAVVNDSSLLPASSWWGDTAIALPQPMAPKTKTTKGWHAVLTSGSLNLSTPYLFGAALFDELPCALLIAG
ncbi:MAG: malto-oligosyltrehalose synthase, partial [Spongiibacteraceae bacterium]